MVDIHQKLADLSQEFIQVLSEYKAEHDLKSQKVADYDAQSNELSQVKSQLQVAQAEIADLRAQLDAQVVASAKKEEELTSNLSDLLDSFHSQVKSLALPKAPVVEAAPVEEVKPLVEAPVSEVKSEDTKSQAEPASEAIASLSTPNSTFVLQPPV